MSPLVDVQESTPVATSEEIDRLRLRYGFWIIITGFALVFLITIISTFRRTEVTSVATVVGAVASLVGTVVGAFFGIQVGSAGKERAQTARERSDDSGGLVHVTARIRRTAMIGNEPIGKAGASHDRYLGPNLGEYPFFQKPG